MIFIFNLAWRKGIAATEKDGDRAYLEGDSVYIPPSILDFYLPYHGSSPACVYVVLKIWFLGKNAATWHKYSSFLL